MPRKLVKLKITEVASVDRGAGEGVRVVLSKRDDEPYWKREFSAEERRRDAKSGAALPDGSYPIHNRSDLSNAMQAIGRAKNPGKAKAHIRARARALGLTSMLSDAFKRENGWLAKAREAFGNSIASILGAATDVEKVEELIGASADQFVEHVAGMTDDLGGEIGKGEAMSPEILKALGLAGDASESAILKAIDTLKARGGRKGDEKGGGKEGGEKEGGEREEREEDEEREREKADKKEREEEEEREREREKERKKALPAEVVKALADAEVLKRQVAELTKAAQLEGLKKKAIDVGLPASEAETLMKAYAGGGNEAVDKILTFLKAAHAQVVEAGLFKEIGSTGDGSTSTALDQLKAKATELRKANPALSADQAFAKVYTDPENAKLASLERSENRPTIVASR